MSVIIPAFSLDRWEQLERAVEGARAQSLAPLEVIVPIDRNPELLERSASRWASPGAVPVSVIDGSGEAADDAERALHQGVHGSRRRFGAGVARNAAASMAKGEVLAFLDDDAWPDPDWLERLVQPYRHPRVVAVGGRPVPEYETARPWWFPPEFDWVFGCAYEGLPTEVAPLRHLIGANMSVRRKAFWELGGFHSVDFDDLDLCQRLADRFDPSSLMYVPDSVVHHWVSAERVSWPYFWRRCFYVNRYKVGAFEEMGEAANLRAETAFVGRFAASTARRVAEGARRRDAKELAYVGVGGLGIALAGLGHVAGRLDAMRRSSRNEMCP